AESLGGRGKNARADTRTQSGANAAVTVVQFHRYAGYFHENFGKEFAKEHIRLACADDRGMHAISAEDIQPVTECISNALLRCPEHLGAAMGIEIEVDKTRTQNLVMQKAFCPVSEWKDFKSVAARCHCLSEGVHLCVVEAVSEMVFRPTVQYTGAVDAQ